MNQVSHFKFRRTEDVKKMDNGRLKKATWMMQEKNGQCL